MAAHRYWRVYATAVNAGSAMAASEIEWRGAVGGADLANGGTPTASQTDGGYVAANAFDNNISTFWVTNSGQIPAWIKYDFGSAVDIRELAYRARNDSYGPNEAPRDFVIQYSDDDASWTTEATVAGSTGWAAGELRTWSWGPAAYNFWSSVLALNPAVLWKLDETSGLVAADSSGNNRPGTYPAAGFVYGQSSMIPNGPGSSSVSNTGGTNNYIIRGSETWMNVGAGSFTAMFTIRPSVLARRDIMGKVESWQFWLETNGALSFYLTPPWTSVSTAAGVVAIDTNYLVLVRRHGGRATIWVNGVKVADAANSSTLTTNTQQLRVFGSSIGNNGSFGGRGQGFAYWPSTGLTDTQIGDLYAQFISAPSPPPPPPPPPNTPTLSLSGTTQTTAAFTSSAFSSSEAVTHAASQWQVAAYSDTTFSAPITDSGWSADLLAHTATPLLAGGVYRARLRHSASNGQESAWSTAVILRTAQVSGPTLYDTFTAYVEGPGIPAGWQNIQGTRSYAVASGSGYGGKELRLTGDVSACAYSKVAIRSSDAVNTTAAIQDVLVNVGFDADAGPRLVYIYTHFSAQDAYHASLDYADGSPTLRVANFQGLGGVIFGTTTLPVFAATERVWVRFRVDTQATPTQLKVKFWQGTPEDEPLPWTAEYTYTYKFSGYAALGIIDDTCTSRWNCDYFALGLDGADAPYPPAEEPPGPMGAFTFPTENLVVSGTVPVAWGVSTNTSSYRLQQRIAGVWSDLSVVGSAAYSWNTAAIAWRPSAMIRVRAENVSFQSEWMYSPQFTIWQGDIGAVTEFSIANRTTQSVMVEVSDTAGLRRVEAQIAYQGNTFTTPLVTVTGGEYVERRFAWITALKHDTIYSVRLRAQTLDGVWTAWFPAQIFRTLNVPGGIKNPPSDWNAVRGAVGAIDGYHGENIYATHAYTNARIAPSVKQEFSIDLLDRYGAYYAARGVGLQRGTWYANESYGQGSAGRSHVRIASSSALYGAPPRNTSSMLMAFIPTEAVSMELMGTGGIYAWANAAGDVFIATHPRPTVDSLTMGNTEVTRLRLNELNVLYMGWAQPYVSEWVSVDPCACPVAIATDGLSPALTVHAALNGSLVKRVDADPGTTTGSKNAVYRAATYGNFNLCDVIVSCPTSWVGAAVGWYDFGRGSPWSHIWAAPIGGNGYPMRGIVLEAAVFPRLLEDSEVAGLTDAILMGVDPRTAILNAGPAAYLPFDEYPAPGKPVASFTGAV